MRAVIVDPLLPGRLALRDVAAEVAAPSEAIVKLAAFSLNLGEVRRALQAAEAGWRPGWDLAGVVVQAAKDGSGPREGARVVGFRDGGAWVEEVAVASTALAVLPETVSFAQAATLPVAGLTALLALEQGGLLVGRKVLVNGASGGVGHFACQLARHGGAEVVANLRRESLAPHAKAEGAATVTISDDLSAARRHAPFDVILESVGGQALGAALTMLRPGGICISYGNSLRSETSFNVYDFFKVGGARLYGLYLIEALQRVPAGEGLARLAKLVAAGQLTPRIAIEAPWTQIAEIAAQLYGRKISGKAVLHL